LIIVFLALIIKDAKIPEYKEEQIPVFTYKQKGDIQYEVYLKPNILYEQPSLGEGNIYITEFVDTIEASFSYAFDGERISGIRGECEIIATVEGFSDLSANEKSNASGDTKTIWKKEYILWPKTITQVQKKSDSFSKKVSIPFNEYKNFSNEVQTLSRVSLSTRLLVTMNTTLTAETDQGPIIEANSQALIIPLDENSFEIRKVILGEPEITALDSGFASHPFEWFAFDKYIVCCSNYTKHKSLYPLYSTTEYLPAKSITILRQKKPRSA
jgi:hypothetical protein